MAEKYSQETQNERFRNQARVLQQKYKKNLDLLWQMKDTAEPNRKAIDKLEEENEKMFNEIESLYDRIEYPDD